MFSLDCQKWLYKSACVSVSNRTPCALVDQKQQYNRDDPQNGDFTDEKYSDQVAIYPAFPRFTVIANESHAEQNKPGTGFSISLGTAYSHFRVSSNSPNDSNEELEKSRVHEIVGRYEPFSPEQLERRHFPENVIQFLITTMTLLSNYSRRRRVFSCSEITIKVTSKQIISPLL